MNGLNFNVVAVIVSALVPMIVGYFWYGPLFGAQWMKLVGVSKKDMEAKKAEMPKVYGMMFVGALIMSYVLSKFIILTGTGTLLTGAIIGFWAWLGFVATTQLARVLFMGTTWNLFLMDTGYNLVSLIIMGAILGYWR